MASTPALARQSSKKKQEEIAAIIGFPSDKMVDPQAITLQRYAVEQFYENAKHSELNNILLPDHIEHGFKIITDAAKNVKFQQLQQIIDHIFLFAYIEILFFDYPERTKLFLNRQAKFTSFSTEFIDQLANLKPDLTDSIPEVFDHLLSPLEYEFSTEFCTNIEKFVDENTAPALAYLLCPFLHHRSEEMEGETKIAKTFNKNPYELFPTLNYYVNYLSESMTSKLKLKQSPYGEYKIQHQYSVFVISKPRMKSSQLPIITCYVAPKYAEHVALDAAGSSFVYSYETQIIYSKQTDHKMRQMPFPISALAMSPCGKWVLSGDIIGSVMLQHVSEDRYANYQPVRPLITSVAFPPNHSHQFAVGNVKGQIYLYITSRTKFNRQFVGHTGGISTLTFHANSEYLASSSNDGTIRIWCISSGNCVRLFKPFGKIPTDLRFSHCGHKLVSSSSDGMVTILDVGNGKCLKNFKAAEVAINSVDFTNNDRMVVGFDRLGNFFVWETVELYGSAAIASVRIDKVRIGSMVFLNCDEIRVVGCLKV